MSSIYDVNFMGMYKLLVELEGEKQLFLKNQVCIISLGK